MVEAGHLCVGSVVIETKRSMFARMVEFWCRALHYVPREPLEDWALLRDPRAGGPNVAIQQTAEEEPSGPVARIHLDLYSNDPEGEVRRLIGLGASMVEPARADRDFVTLADPDGNLLDIIDKRGFAFGQRSP